MNESDNQLPRVQYVKIRPEYQLTYGKAMKRAGMEEWLSERALADVLSRLDVNPDNMLYTILQLVYGNCDSLTDEELRARIMPQEQLSELKRIAAFVEQLTCEPGGEEFTVDWLTQFLQYIDYRKVTEGLIPGKESEFESKRALVVDRLRALKQLNQLVAVYS